MCNYLSKPKNNNLYKVFHCAVFCYKYRKILGIAKVLCPFSAVYSLGTTDSFQVNLLVFHKQIYYLLLIFCRKIHLEFNNFLKCFIIIIVLLTKNMYCIYCIFYAQNCTHLEVGYFYS